MYPTRFKAMTKNRIIVFANQKGGAGKTSLCVMMAHWLTDQGKNVLVYDADAQQTLLDHRADDLKANPNISPKWEVRHMNALDREQTVRELEQAAQFMGYVLIDAPGALVYPGLTPILQTADAVAIPFSYDYNVLKSTLKFIKVLLSDDIQQETSRLFFIPNKIAKGIGTKEELERNEQANKELSKCGTLTYPVKRFVGMERYSTLSWNSYQEHATMGAWSRIVNRLSRLK